MTLVRCELGEPDESGRRQPVAVEGSRFTLAADTVIFAVGPGHGLTTSSRAAKASRLENGQIRVDRDTCMTDRPGVVRRRRRGGHRSSTRRSRRSPPAAAPPPPSTTTCAARRCCPSGKTSRTPRARAARSWPRSLVGQRVPRADGRRPASRAPTGARSRTGYGAGEAVAEAERCLACAVCSDCGSCVRACPSGAIDLERARVARGDHPSAR